VSLIKQLTKAALAAEIESHLTQDLKRNRKNGTSSKPSKAMWAIRTKLQGRVKSKNDKTIIIIILKIRWFGWKLC
jgi:hypothetical protein